MRELVKMPVSNVEDNLSKRERELVAENRILKTRLARLERNPALAQREQIEHSSRFPEENPYPVFRVDADGTLVYANPACENLLADLDGQSGRSLPEQWLDLVRSALDSQTIERAEYQHGNRVYAFRAVPVNNANHVNVYGVDITEQKLIRGLSESVVKSSPIGISIYNSVGDCISANDAFANIIGTTRDLVLQQNFHQIESWKKCGLYTAALSAIQEKEEKRLEVEVKTTFNKIGSFACYLNFFRVGNESHILLMINDITKRKQAERALWESEEKYKSLFENMQNGFALHEMVFDETGQPVDYIFLDVNKAFEKQTTLRRENLIGRRVTEVLPGTENDPADWIGTYGKVVLTGNSISFENYSEVLKKWYSIVAYKPNDGQFAVLFIDITNRKHALQEVLNNQAQLKSLTSELVLAEERERNRIAVHLHDEVSQSLAYSKMKLQMVSAALDNQAPKNDITEVCDTLSRVMHEVHSLTFELSTPVLTELGLEKAISHWLQKQVEQKHGIATKFTDDGQTKFLEEDIQAMLFRSVRELLVNVVKHSQAKCVEASVFREEDQIVIHLEDDGIGFAPDKVVIDKDVGGFGLFSIRERLSHMGGSLEIDSSPGQGCRSILYAPLQQS
jgi:PAS domain S-box-containing protein